MKNQRLGFTIGAGALAATLLTIIILIPFAESGAPAVINSIQGTPTPVPTSTPAPVALSLTPLQSADDGYENYGAPGAINTGSTSGIVGANTTPANRSTVAIRFDNVAIPQGQVITSADLTMWATATGHGLQNAHVFGFDKDDQAGVLTQILVGETWTTANVLWDELVQVTDNNSLTSPSLVSVIQEIVDRPGWVSGNGLVLVVDGDNVAPLVNMFTTSWDSGNSAQFPTLAINFTP